MKQNRNEVLKKRYQVYRKLGYDSKTSRVLSQRALDVSKLEISDKTGQLKRNKTTKQFIETDMRDQKAKIVIDRYTDKAQRVPNDTVYSQYAMLIRDKRYRGETGRIISILKTRHNLTTDQAYYMFHTMVTNNMTYQMAKDQLLTSADFEQYDKRKRRKAKIQL